MAKDVNPKPAKITCSSTSTAKPTKLEGGQAQVKRKLHSALGDSSTSTHPTTTTSHTSIGLDGTECGMYKAAIKRHTVEHEVMVGKLEEVEKNITKLTMENSALIEELNKKKVNLAIMTERINLEKEKTAMYKQWYENERNLRNSGGK